MNKAEIAAKNYTVTDCSDLLSAVDEKIRTAYIRGFRRGAAKFSRYQEEPHTNAGKLRAMTDEELADFLAFEQGQIVKKLASKFGFLEHRSLYPTPIEWLSWLQQEASDDEC